MSLGTKFGNLGNICGDNLWTLDGWMDGSFGNRVETILRIFWVVLFEELVYKSSFVENYGNNFRLFIGGHFELWKK
jgi:hypothetical protein